MRVVYFLLYLLSAICFAVAAFTSRSSVDANGGRSGGRNLALVPLGLLLWVLVPLLQTLQTLDD